MMLEKLIKKLKGFKDYKYRKSVIALGVIILFTALYILFVEPEINLFPPVVTIEPDAHPPILGTVRLLKAEPPSGEKIEVLDKKVALMFEFSSPIDLASVKVAVNPYIELETKMYEHSPNTIYITPRQTLWEEETEYHIKIVRLKSIYGDYLEKPVEHVFQYKIPDEIIGGDAGYVEPIPRPGQ